MSVLRPVAALAGVTLVLFLPSPVFAGTSVDRARVVAVDPVYRTVTYSVPVEECRLVDVPVNEPADGYRSYTAPIVGAIIGGAIGNAVGHNKTNKKVGTAVGAILGGTIGRDIGCRNAENRGYRRVAYRTEEVCETGYETREEAELDGYDVTYRYAGETHTTRMDHDPGNYLHVRVRVTPV
jgi:uncharacterized protein YcfJ